MNQGIFSLPGEAGAPSFGLVPARKTGLEHGFARGIRIASGMSPSLLRARRVPRLCAPPIYLPKRFGGAAVSVSVDVRVPAGLPPDADLVFLTAWQENASTVGPTVAFTGPNGEASTPAAIVAPNAPGAVSTPVVGAYGLRRGNFVPGLNTLLLTGFADVRTFVGACFPISGLDPSTWIETSAQVTSSAVADDATASMALLGNSLILGIATAQGFDMNPVRLVSTVDYEFVARGIMDGSSSTTTEVTLVIWSGYAREGIQTLTQTAAFLGTGSISGGGVGDGRSILTLAMQAAA